MRKSYFITGLLPLAAGCLLTGCVDDGYDVGDIDTTSQINVNNLVIPLNLESIKIDKVIDLDDNENISINDQGFYAIEKSGAISTDPFRINAITVAVPSISPNSINIPTGSAAGSTVPGVSVEVDVPSEMSRYDISLSRIDEKLIKLSKVNAAGQIKLAVTLSVSQSTWDALGGISFNGLCIQLPKNLVDAECDLGSYDPETGELVLHSGLTMASRSLPITITASGMKNDEDIVGGNLSISGDVGIINGAKMAITTGGSAIPSEIGLNVAYVIDKFNVKSFCGKVNYDMEAINIQDIDLSGLPDFLDSPETRIYLADPTINININNPVGGYMMAGKGTLQLSSKFNGTSEPSVAAGEMQIPAAVEPTDIFFNNGNMAGLSSILVSENGGQGLPKSIGVTVKDLVFAGDVVDFPVGSDIQGANGFYSFSAPLGFEEGSRIVYEKTESGWYDDDLKGLNINTLNLTATCSTDLPVGLTLRAYPLDRDGNRMPVDENTNHFKVTANSTDTPVTFSIKAADGTTIHDLDGISFVATISQDKEVNGSTAPLGPNQFIVLDDLRIKVDGFYVKEF